MGVYSKNSEILFLYDAKLTNPNGDPDDENKPRSEEHTSELQSRPHISFNDTATTEIYTLSLHDALPIYGEIVDATERLRRFFEKENKKVNLNKLTKEDVDFILSKLIDVRLFGATMPIKEIGRAHV